MRFTDDVWQLVLVLYLVIFALCYIGADVGTRYTKLQAEMNQLIKK